MPASRRHLTLAQNVTILNYLTERQEALAGLPFKTIIAAVKENTGIDMTLSNLDNLRTAPGMEWLTPTRGRPKAKLSNNERVMAQCLFDLYAKTGDEPPDALLDLLQES